MKKSPYYLEDNATDHPSLLAVIREDECIGCTKCIQACPTDAIMGAAKVMHSVINDECSGCELCVEPCPVDCIDIIELNAPLTSKKIAQYQQRHETRNQRLERDRLEKLSKHKRAKSLKSEVAAAVARAKAKRNELTKD